MMKRLLFTIILAGLMLIPAWAPAQVPGEMLFQQGCDAFDLVEDLGSPATPVGQKGRWLVRNLRTGEELVYAFEDIDLVPPVLDNPFAFSGTTFVAWKFEGTGIQGTNRTEFSGTWEDATFTFSAFWEGQVIRGNHYKSGGISGISGGSLLDPTDRHNDVVRMVLCKAGFGGEK